MLAAIAFASSLSQITQVRASTTILISPWLFSAHPIRVRVVLAAKRVGNGARAPNPPTARPLPRALPRPTLGEVNMSPIQAVYPELAGVAPEYIRDHLSSFGPQLLAIAANTRASPPKSYLPKELEVIHIADTGCPTHFLAVYSNSPATPRRNVVMYPVHYMVLAVHCANLPSLPRPRNTDATKKMLPVVPLNLPSPDTFSLLLTYFYTMNTKSLLASLLPSDNTRDMASLTRLARMAHGIWRNACALGVVDEPLFDTIDEAWASVTKAIEEARS